MSTQGGNAAFGQGLPPAGGWKRHMTEGERPAYDHEWVSEIINERNRLERELLDARSELEGMRKRLVHAESFLRPKS